jgi:hypothetical protein
MSGAIGGPIRKSAKSLPISTPLNAKVPFLMPKPFRRELVRRPEHHRVDVESAPGIGSARRTWLLEVSPRQRFEHGNSDKAGYYS